jgi:hypothetical protein
MTDEPGSRLVRYMGMRLIPVAVAVVTALAAAGCRRDLAAAARPDPFYGPTDPMAKVVQDVNANNAKITTLRCAHSFQSTIVDDQGKSRTFTGDGYLLFMKPDNLLLTAGGIIKYFEVGSNAEQYWFTAFPDEVSTQWWGQKTNLTDEQARQIPIRPDLILEVLGVSTLNEDFLVPPVPTMRFNNDADAYMFVWNKPLSNRWVAEKEVWYDRKTKLPKLVLLFDANGRIILRAYLTDHQPVEGSTAKIASNYDLFFPENKSTMSFRLTDIKESIQRGRARIPNANSFDFPDDPGVRKQIEIK